jgi:hypothetical protein
MKYIILITFSAALTFLCVYGIKFTDGWVVWYLLAIPFFLRYVLSRIYKKYFGWNAKNNRNLNLLTLFVYIVIVLVIYYGIETMDFGNSWI